MKTLVYLFFLAATAAINFNYVASQPTLYGLAPADAKSATCFTSSATLCTVKGTPVRVRLFGVNITNTTLVSMTTNEETCEESRDGPFRFVFESGPAATTTGHVELDFPATGLYYVCLGANSKSYRHQGTESWKSVQVTSSTSLPIWLSILFIAILMILSGIFSGLNLGLMSLDPMELKVVMRGGSKKEQKWASKIEPIRRHGNYLLCTLLFGNVLVNSAFTILLDDLTSGVVAVVASTAAIVVFGEIVPQSICSRHGLSVGARTIWLTYFFMTVTFPVSFPVSKILDWLLGDEVGTVYNRRQLLELVRVAEQYADLDHGEVGMLSGVLGFKEKKVNDVMTKLDDAFLLNIEKKLDFKTISEITQRGHSRIPVYEVERANIIGILYTRDLSLLDPDDSIPLRTIIKHYDHPILRVWDLDPLDQILETFRSNRNHMGIVQRVNNEGEGDPFYETLGIITLEDVIEEIIQSEIIDETDTIVDNQTREPVESRNVLDLSHYRALNSDADEQTKIGPQLAWAVFQFLSAELDAFRPDSISFSVLKRLLNRSDVLVDIESNHPSDDEKRYIYQKGKVANHFVLILRGNVEVIVGQENLKFERGPFSYFGQSVLGSQGGKSSPSISGYKPDYSVHITGSVQYVKISRIHYIKAREATLLEPQSSSNQTSNTSFSSGIESNV